MNKQWLMISSGLIWLMLVILAVKSQNQLALAVISIGNALLIGYVFWQAFKNRPPLGDLFLVIHRLDVHSTIFEKS